MSEGQQRKLQEALELLTEWLVDNCPEDLWWEDFASEVDTSRGLIMDVLEGE